MPRLRKIVLLIVAISIGGFLSLGVTASQADNAGDMNVIQDIQHLDWAVDPGILDGAESAAVADSVAGAAGIMAMGPIGVAAGGVMVIQAVWESGLGSAIGTWLASGPGVSLYQSGFITGEQWCPFVQPTNTGPYGTATVVLPAIDGSSCGNTSAGFHTVAMGGEAPPQNQQQVHSLNTDVENYYTYQWQGNCVSGLSNQGMFGQPNNGGGNEFSMVVDTNPGFWVNTITGAPADLNYSAKPYSCMNDAFTEYTTQLSNTGWLVKSGNDDCVIAGAGAIPHGGLGNCGTGGETCGQEAIIEMAAGAPSNERYNGPCYFVIASEKQMLEDTLGGLSLKPCGLAGQVTCTSNANAPAHIGTNTNCVQSGCAAALNALTTHGPATNTPDTQSVLQEVECFLNGTCTTKGPVSIPRPQITETYDQYISRLRRLGFWGHIFTVDDDMDYPADSPGYLLTPGAMTEVEIGTNPAQPIYWPVPGHHLSGAPEPSGNDSPGDYYQPGWKTQSANPKTDDITILKVPDGYDPNTGGGVGGGGGPCNCPGINFNPLTHLNYGSKFPFGAFSLMNSALGSLSGDSSGTPVTIHLGANSVMGSHDYTLSSSEWEDTYRPIIFPIIEFMMTLMIVVFALRLLRHPGGDEEVSEAP